MISLILGLVSAIKPNNAFNKKLFKTVSRRKVLKYYASAMVVFFILIGVVADRPSSEEYSKNPPENIANTNLVANEDSQEKSNTLEKDTKATTEDNDKPNLTGLYSVVKVVDGDTIDVDIDGSVKRLRLIGLDTPETVDPRKPVQCFGRDASNKAKELLGGKKVRLESDASQGDQDKYNRLLRYVYLEDGAMYNKLMISEGYAHEYTYNSPYAYQAEFKQAQKDAQNNGKGLWSSNSCNGDTNQTTSQETVRQSSPAITPAPAVQVSPSQSSDCDPNYSPCIPNVAYDLDCKDISIRVQVIGVDRHRFDRDGDGIGCESNSR